MRGFLVKLLMGTTFDVFIDSSRLHPSAPRSAPLVEALWRRREGLPGALPIVLNVIQRSVGRRDAAEELRDVLETAQLGVCARTFNIGCLGLRLSVTVTFLCISLGRRAYPLCARGLAASLLSSRWSYIATCTMASVRDRLPAQGPARSTRWWPRHVQAPSPRNRRRARDLL